MSNIGTENKVALFLADGFETIEALTVADILYRAGIPCTKVSITGSTAVVSSHQVTVIADTTIESLDLDDFDMLVLPGGVPGTPNLRACAPLMEQVATFHDSGRMIAAICAAPSIFAELGYLTGVHSTCHPSVEESLIFGDAVLVREAVVKDGNIITSQAMGTAIPFALAIVEHYKGKEAADAIGKAILYLK